MKYDLLIKNAKIIDGSNTPWYMGDVAVAEGKIAAEARTFGSDDILGLYH